MSIHNDVQNEWSMIRSTKFWAMFMEEIKRERELFANKCLTEPSSRQVYHYDGDRVTQIVTETNEKSRGHIMALDFVSRLPETIKRKAAEQDGITIQED